MTIQTLFPLLTVGAGFTIGLHDYTDTVTPLTVGAGFPFVLCAVHDYSICTYMQTLFPL